MKKTRLKLNCKEIEFKIDTGAAVTAISDQTYHHDGNKFSKLFGQALAALKEFHKVDADLKREQKRYFNPIPNNSEVWITSGDKPIAGKVSEAFSIPRSYNIPQTLTT